MGKKEKQELVNPVVKRYRVEVLNKSNDPATVFIGNGGHSMETKIPGRAQWAKLWEISFTDVPDCTITSAFGKKSFGLKETHMQTNSFLIEDDAILCKNPSPLPPRKTTASPEIYGTRPEEHIEILKNGSRTECNYSIGDDWHNITGTLESGNHITWKLVIIKVAQKITHQWCKIDELGSRRNKFSVVGVRSYDGDDPEEADLDYRDHKFEINDNLELIRDGGQLRLWKWDWE